MPAKLAISTTDQSRALEFAADLAACMERGELSAAFRELPRLVGGESVTFGEVRVPSDPDGPLEMQAECSDPTVYDEEMMDAMRRLWRQQPVIMHQLHNPSPHPVRISDLDGAVEWRRSELHNDGYRRVGLVHEMACHFSMGPGRVSCAALHRSGSDFSEREKALLGLIAPHLGAALDRVDQNELLVGQVVELKMRLRECGGRQDDVSAVSKEDVRDALRNYHRPAALSRSRLAVGVDRRARAEFVRAIIDEGIAEAFGDSPEQRLLRTVLERGYVDPRAKHERVAADLFLSRSSYFRRLARGSEQLAAWLLGSVG